MNDHIENVYEIKEFMTYCTTMFYESMKYQRDVEFIRILEYQSHTRHSGKIDTVFLEGRCRGGGDTISCTCNVDADWEGIEPEDPLNQAIRFFSAYHINIIDVKLNEGLRFYFKTLEKYDQEKRSLSSMIYKEVLPRLTYLEHENEFSSTTDQKV